MYSNDVTLLYNVHFNISANILYFINSTTAIDIISSMFYKELPLGTLLDDNNSEQHNTLRNRWIELLPIIRDNPSLLVDTNNNLFDTVFDASYKEAINNFLQIYSEVAFSLKDHFEKVNLLSKLKNENNNNQLRIIPWSERVTKATVDEKYKNVNTLTTNDFNDLKIDSSDIPKVKSLVNNNENGNLRDFLYKTWTTKLVILYFQESVVQPTYDKALSDVKDSFFLETSFPLGEFIHYFNDFEKYVFVFYITNYLRSSLNRNPRLVTFHDFGLLLDKSNEKAINNELKIFYDIFVKQNKKF